MPSNKVLAISGAVVATAAIIGTVAVVRAQRKNNEEDDDVFSTPSSKVLQSKRQQPTAAQNAAPKASPKPAAVEPAATKEAPSAVEKVKVVDGPAKVEPKAPSEPVAPADAGISLLDEALNELEPAAPAAPPAPPAPESKIESKTAKPPTAVDFADRKAFNHLGIAMKVPNGWDVREELSPIPNVAMVTVWNPEFENFPNAEMPGAVPVIILSVEDIRGENLNLTEFKERSKDLSMQQMLMMTGGVVQPMVRKDSSVQEGPFRHILEYAQSMPPFFDLSVINLLEVRNGVAYVFQIMCNPKIMNEYRPIFLQLARDTLVTPMDSSALGFYRVHTGEVAVDIDTTWSWSYPSADETASSPFLAQFQLASTVKKEEVTLYEEDKVPVTEHKLRNKKTVDGVTICSAFDGAQEKKTLSYNNYVLVVRPQQKAISYLSETSLVRTIKSVAPSSEERRPKSGATFVTPEYGYQFDVVGGSRVVSTKLGNGTVVYAPQGIPADPSKAVSPEEQGPTVTIRIGKPETDPDCMGSIAEWRSRIEEEAANGSITSIQVVNLKGQECLTFMSKEMQEVSPNEKVEVRGKVFIFVRDGVTTLVRWESATGTWRKYERDMDAFLASFEFIEDSA
ncbi:putative mitochondrial hypothetical protein [Leptomonas pyrrhocoris]|uniref:Uncharacterized protein n=1 Tax=Leptomonas pyrrhocoris TaxID=157538 RepID=A0A0M9FWQ3_LEPPY|nr:putative mitochondrial hypothetical protein [Leptomonas pyrrhocoris]XP_015656064.1 putative mitochondrial hypothetical protein [Leptomonas pyrrhocoris]KPA77624.1 putative mitochondrial hypothetical protein [Leptomonas pyrrhocoris]KPA77625.1 putative mitochondrial hypothetical protein [Leptomonas pyrrhocoris]|eukprot:XP_015656063.1 putative mitochondrial hypothetical protein [Leptomonas pyrrhocoris]